MVSRTISVEWKPLPRDTRKRIVRTQITEELWYKLSFAVSWHLTVLLLPTLQGGLPSSLFGEVSSPSLTSVSLHLLFPLFGNSSSTFSFPLPPLSTKHSSCLLCLSFTYQVPSAPTYMSFLQENFLDLSVWTASTGLWWYYICYHVFHVCSPLWTVSLLEAGIVPALFPTISQVLTWYLGQSR